jgi:molecular chaperone GrpE
VGEPGERSAARRHAWQRQADVRRGARAPGRREGQTDRRVPGEVPQCRLRLRREIAKDIERSRRDILSDLLEVLDNLDRALDSARQGGSQDALLQGVEMVRRQFLSKLESFGVKRIESDQQPFDPMLHEAISSVPAQTPDQDGLVIGTVRTGYRIGDDVLRPAAVAVAKAE